MKYNDITEVLEEIFLPVSALLVYQSTKNSSTVYVESYDINESGEPTNAHPLSLKESSALAKALRNTEFKKSGFLTSDGLLPANLQYIDLKKGRAIWTTPMQEVALSFTEKLQIESGKAFVPPLLWRASREELYIYALLDVQKPATETSLYKAPFFNIHDSGKVCMGTVNLKFPADCSLQQFMQLWEGYFFNSLFSHLIAQQSPVKGNIVQLWQRLVNTGRKFPLKSLIKSNYTIQNLLP